jgi:TatD DNase family protein
MFVDTHSHVYLDAFREDLNEVIQRSKEAGVERILLPNIDLESLPGLLNLCELDPTLFRPMIGLHPCDVFENYKEVLATLETYISQCNPIAIGETGLDLYWKKDNIELQIASFEIQIKWAKKYQLPLVIHARDSFEEIFEVLDRHNDSTLRGVFHCFTGGKQEIEKVNSYGNFYFGIGGSSTYPKNNYREILPFIPREKLLLETDAPFLSPVPHRGKRNEPSYVPYVADFIAKSLGVSEDEIEALTTANAQRLFKID